MIPALLMIASMYPATRSVGHIRSVGEGLAGRWRASKLWVVVVMVCGVGGRRGRRHIRPPSRYGPACPVPSIALHLRPSPPTLQGTGDETTPGGIAMALSEPLGSGLFVGNIVFAIVILVSSSSHEARA